MLIKSSLDTRKKFLKIFARELILSYKIVKKREDDEKGDTARIKQQIEIQKLKHK